MQEPEHILDSGRSIKEAMRIYGLSVDTLYYYESKGLISPKRNPDNGYRIFGPDEFYRLNIITELRAMDFDLEQISTYLENHTFATTFDLLNYELKLIDEQMEHLRLLHDDIVDSFQRYSSSMSLAQTETISIVHIPKRTCLQVFEGYVYHRDIPYLFAKRCHEQDIPLRTMHSTPCYVVNQNIVLDNGCFAPVAVLLSCPSVSEIGDYPLEGGLYATCTFGKALDHAPCIYARMMKYLTEQGYEPCGNALEFCLVGEYESDDKAEFANRLEVPVRLKQT